MCKKLRDMRWRVHQKAKRERWMKMREVQRTKCTVLKVNFVAGILNRFFHEFLQNFHFRDLKSMR